VGQDHFNDVVSNALSIVAIVLATQVDGLWFFDPLFAILFAFFIMYNWSQTGRGASCRALYTQLVMIRCVHCAQQTGA
jgi:divalent metal cation (Fe/Co/Zn/Cd) transporter